MSEGHTVAASFQTMGHKLSKARDDKSGGERGPSF